MMHEPWKLELDVRVDLSRPCTVTRPDADRHRILWHRSILRITIAALRFIGYMLKSPSTPQNAHREQDTRRLSMAERLCSESHLSYYGVLEYIIILFS